MGARLVKPRAEAQGFSAFLGSVEVCRELIRGRRFKEGETD